MNKNEPQQLPLSLYVHFPWCIKKCPYCDFNSHTVTAPVDELFYVQSLLRDFRNQSERFNLSGVIQSIFMGGGTPSLFSADALEKLLTGLNETMVFANGIEITLEANPGTFEQQKFADYRRLGINRLSIGVQSFDDRHLQVLGRIHSADEAKNAVRTAYAAGFENINLDLMFGLPQQTLAEAAEDVEQALMFSPQHLSLYEFTLEPNTWFYKYPPQLPADEEKVLMKETCQQKLRAHGYIQYEVSAYAKAQRQCRHNLNYWQFGDYIGIGAGAHGKITLDLPDDIVRTSKLKNPGDYLARPDHTAVVRVEQSQLPVEFLMNHLRLPGGFHQTHLASVSGLSTECLEPQLSRCIAKGLLEQREGQIRCTRKGWNYLDSILEEFI